MISARVVGVGVGIAIVAAARPGWFGNPVYPRCHWSGAHQLQPACGPCPLIGTATVPPLCGPLMPMHIVSPVPAPPPLLEHLLPPQDAPSPDMMMMMMTTTSCHLQGAAAHVPRVLPQGRPGRACAVRRR